VVEIVNKDQGNFLLFEYDINYYQCIHTKINFIKIRRNRSVENNMIMSNPAQLQQLRSSIEPSSIIDLKNIIKSSIK